MGDIKKQRIEGSAMKEKETAGKCQMPKSALYTVHGQKRLQGFPGIINGKRSLAYYEKGRLVGFTTLDEILKLFYEGELPELYDEKAIEK